MPVEVVGVARPEFLGLDPFPAEFWVPLPLSGVVAGGPDLFSPDRPARLTALLRLKPGVTPQAARSALLAWSRQATADRPPSRRVNGIFLELHATPIALGQNAVGFAPIFAAFGLVLLIACANVSNMMLARALSRQREMGIRVSLGAGRARVRDSAAVAGFGLRSSALHAGVRYGRLVLPPGERRVEPQRCVG